MFLMLNKCTFNFQFQIFILQQYLKALYFSFSFTSTTIGIRALFLRGMCVSFEESWKPNPVSPPVSPQLLHLCPMESTTKFGQYAWRHIWMFWIFVKKWKKTTNFMHFQTIPPWHWWKHTRRGGQINQRQKLKFACLLQSHPLSSLVLFLWSQQRRYGIISRLSVKEIKEFEGCKWWT